MSIRELLSSTGVAVLPPTREWRYIGSSRVITPDVDMDVILHLIGAGGGGGYGTGLNSAAPMMATGGGAGGYAKKRVTLKAGVSYTFTVGAAGGHSGTGQQNGTNGGDTSVVGGTLTITAGGGKGGKIGIAINTTVAGGDGGIATGGDINRTGGRGGNIAATANTNGWYVTRATGGGGVNLLGENTCAGGDLVGPANGLTGSVLHATGGGGIGGSAPSQGYGGGSGGGTGGSPFGSALGSLSLNGSAQSLVTLSRNFMGFWDAIGPLNAGGQAGPGAGGYTSGPNANPAGVFGGAGGVCHYQTIATGNSAAIGGGGPGVWSGTGTSSAAFGGPGLILMEVLS